jgi:hypothetical protein
MTTFEWLELLTPRGGSTGCYAWHHDGRRLCDHEHDLDDARVGCEDSRIEMSRILAETPRHVYRPLNPTPGCAGVGTGPCQYPGCAAETNSVTHGALNLGITRKAESTHG